MLIFDPQDTRTIYLGTEKKGLFASFDAAESWQEIKELPKEKISAIAVNPKAKHIVYVSIKNQIFKTTDANRTWKSIYLDTLPNVEITSLAISPLFVNTVIASFSDGRIIRSRDGGLSWTILKNFKRKVGQVLINPYNTRIIYAILPDQGIFRSKDQGLSWSSLKENYKAISKGLRINQMIFNPNFPDALIGVGKTGLLQTRDGGQTWSKYKIIISSIKAKIYSLAIDPHNPDIIYYATDKTLYRSVDNGKSWSTKPIPGKRVAIKMLIDPVNSNILYLGMNNLKK